MTISISIDELSDDEHYRIYTCLKAKFDQEEMNKILNRDLRHRDFRYHIGGRIIYPLICSGIITIKDLVVCTRSDLLKIKQIGPKSIWEIERLLGIYGLELARE